MFTHTHTPAFKAGIIAAIPGLRRRALSLSRSSDRADDLVQETLLKAWVHQARYQADSNLNAWLFTIMRNSFLNQLRKQKREVQDIDGVYTSRLRAVPAHDATLDLHDFQKALAVLPAPQRQALMLVGALGHSYDEAAALAGSESGTIKSRVSRARRQLMSVLHVAGPMDYASAPPTTAAAPLYACA